MRTTTDRGRHVPRPNFLRPSTMSKGLFGSASTSAFNNNGRSDTAEKRNEVRSSKSGSTQTVLYRTAPPLHLEQQLLLPHSDNSRFKQYFFASTTASSKILANKKNLEFPLQQKVEMRFYSRCYYILQQDQTCRT